jgi:HK97 family phage prohead protease
MKIETGFSFELDTKAINDAGEFEGYASIFDKADAGRDVVRKGAFAKSLAARPANKVKMLRGHDALEPIGIWLSLAEDTKGLNVRGRLILETSRGRETHALMKAGALDGLSIGYRTKKDSFDRVKGLRYLEEVDVPEISVVTFPMMPDAMISAVKHVDPEHARAVVAALNRATSALRAL